MYILGRMREFIMKEEVKQFTAAKQVLTLIERAVCFAYCLVMRTFLMHYF